MYTQLSATQQAVLDSGDCPHCHACGTVKKEWTRTGPTVRCTACKKKVYRPRGRAVTQGQGGSAGKSSSGESHSPDLTSGQSGGKDEQNAPRSHIHLEVNEDLGKMTQAAMSSAAQNAAQAIGAGKPLSQAAQNAMEKIEQALRQEMQKELKQALENAQKQVEQRKQELEQELAEQVEEQVESLRPKEIVVKQVDAKGEVKQVNQVSQSHDMLGEILRRISAGIRNLLLVGPSGSGKSTLARLIAEALGYPYDLLGWSGGTTEGRVLGRPTIDGKGYTMSRWMELYTQPAVFNHDEIDGADPNVPICMNAAIENGLVSLPCGTLKRHAEHIVIATANTWGIGADMIYCGRNQLDAAFRDRFVGGMFTIDYSASLETSLVPEQSYRERFWKIRQLVYKHKLRRIWGTRALVRGASMLRNGYSEPEVFQALTVGFLPDELQKLEVA